jgi:hypothetical protein
MGLSISINDQAAFNVVIGVPGPTGPAGPVGPAGPTFTGGAITSPITYTVGTNTTVFENGDIYTENTATGAYGVVYINGLEASDGTHTLAMTASGITFGDATVQSTAFPGSSAFYPSTGNPSGFLTAASLSGYATQSWVTSQGYATQSYVDGQGFITSSALTGYATESFVTSQGFLTDAPSDGSQYARQDGAWSVVTGGGGGSYLPLAGGTMTGPIVFDGTSGQYISKGNFDTSRGGNYGISLVCSIGYEFNWQAGWLTTTEQSSVTPRPLYLDSLAGTTLRAWNSATNTGTEVGHTGINVANATPYYVNVAPDLVKVFEATNELGVSIAHDSIAIQHIDTPDRTSYFTNEYIGFEDMSGTPHSAYIEHDVITVQDASNTTQMRSTGISLSAAGSITFGDSTVQTTAAPAAVTNNSQLATTVNSYNSAHTLDTSDVNGIVVCTDTCGVIYLPDYSTSAFNNGQQVLVVNNTGSIVVFAASGGASYISYNGSYILAPNGVAAAVKIDTNLWVISGNLTT